jgi:uncharacterized protein (TIGR03086 family)
MTADLLDLYRSASHWTLNKVAGATGKLDAETPCEGWDVRQLLNHMLETQQYFVRSARGQKATLPSATPSEILTADPVADFRRARSETLSNFGEDGMIEKTGPALGIAFSDQLLHGWDIATATGQDSTMPEGLADAAYELIHGQFTEEQRQGVFKPEISVDEGASAQERLLAYTGRNPAG